VNFGNGDYIVTRTPGVLDNVYYAEPDTKSTPAQVPEDYVENLYENWAPSKIVAKPQIKGNGILDNFLMTPSEV